MSRTLIVRLTGGLGNQMFQYASARGIAARNKMLLRVDPLSYIRYRKHRFLLRKITSSASLCRTQDILICRLLRKIVPPHVYEASGIKFVSEENLAYSEINLTENTSTAYLVGYWQSEKYFSSIDSDIRSEFTLDWPLDEVNARLERRIKESAAVAVHVRRGDYISDPSAQAYHGVCSVDYYREGMSIACSSISDPSFYVFSDDISWARANIKTRNRIEFIDHNEGRPWIDIRLMAACRHYVIANSSFSWWGAWLGTAEDKVVVAPHRWFADPRADSLDLVPESWIQI